MMICLICSAPLEGRRKWCAACAAEVNRARAVERNHRLKGQPTGLSRFHHVDFPECRGCGSLFTQRLSGYRRRLYCTADCAVRARRTLDTSHGRELRRLRNVACNRRRRRLTRARIDPCAVFARDGWHCHLCGIATPEAKRGTHDHDAPEMDHRIPLSRGGLHEWSNVRCLCRSCNGFKGKRTDEEVMAVLAA